MFLFREKAVDPVCQMKIDKKNSTHVSQNNGKNYHFCSGHCKDQLNKDPNKYLTQGKNQTLSSCH